MMSLKPILAVSVLLCGVYRSASAADANPLGFTKVGGKQYWVGNYTKVDFAEAKRRCQLYGMDLVSINSQEKYNTVINDVLHGSTGRYWTSGNKINDLVHWVWAEGIPMTYIHWGTGEPNNSAPEKNEYCIELRNKAFNDFGCQQKDYFICESNDKKSNSCVTVKVNCGTENDSCAN